MKAGPQALKGKAILITGAGRGIGKRLAIGVAEAGARVGLLARSRAELDLTRLEIEHAGGTALSLVADVRDFVQVRAAVERLRAEYGRVDAAVAAAAVAGPIGPFSEVDAAAWAEAVRTNLVGVANTCRTVLPDMIARTPRRGRTSPPMPLRRLLWRGSSRRLPKKCATTTCRSTACRRAARTPT
jgi:3-oxoacyl-[acyl-carrier protein] reductase